MVASIIVAVFANYLKGQAQALEKALERNMRSRAARSDSARSASARSDSARSAAARSTGKGKDLRLYRGFYDFLRAHLPDDFALASGKVRNRNHILNRNCDLLIYRKWCLSYLQLTGDYILSDDLCVAISMEAELGMSQLTSYAALTQALKTICSQEKSGSGSRPVYTYSILFAYRSRHRLKTLKENLERVLEEKEIELNRQPDMICLLNQGLLIKDWEKGGQYRGIKTEEDTLMWFYILLLEYLDRDDKMNINLRRYIKGAKEYPEY